MTTSCHFVKFVYKPTDVVNFVFTPTQLSCCKFSKFKIYNMTQLLTLFRTSDHCLLIETCRYRKIPLQQKLCSFCNNIDDEFHFFLQCNLNVHVQPMNILIKTMSDNGHHSISNHQTETRIFIKSNIYSYIGCLYFYNLRNKASTSV